jgi:hypothetical protein
MNHPHRETSHHCAHDLRTRQRVCARFACLTHALGWIGSGWAVSFLLRLLVKSSWNATIINFWFFDDSRSVRRMDRVNTEDDGNGSERPKRTGTAMT